MGFSVGGVISYGRPRCNDHWLHFWAIRPIFPHSLTLAVTFTLPWNEVIYNEVKGIDSQE